VLALFILAQPRYPVAGLALWSVNGPRAAHPDTLWAAGTDGKWHLAVLDSARGVRFIGKPQRKLDARRVR
jgi:hypothetical protein